MCPHASPVTHIREPGRVTSVHSGTPSIAGLLLEVYKHLQTVSAVYLWCSVSSIIPLSCELDIEATRSTAANQITTNFAQLLLHTCWRAGCRAVEQGVKFGSLLMVSCVTFVKEHSSK